jgi:hypothetical protein
LEDDALFILKRTRMEDPGTFVRLVCVLSEMWDATTDEAAIEAHIDGALLSAQHLRMDQQALQIRMAWVRHLLRAGHLTQAQSASQIMLDNLLRLSVDPMTAVRVAACRAQVLVQLGNAHLAQELLRQTKDRLGLKPDSDEFWALTVSHSDLSHSEFKQDFDFDLDALRPRFEGSRFWVTALQTVSLAHQKAGRSEPPALLEEIKFYAEIFQAPSLASVLLRE